MFYNTQKRYSEAESSLVQALEIYRHLYGEQHPKVVLTLNNSASIQYEKGNFRQAEEICIQALNISKNILGDNHPMSINIKKNIEALRQR